MCDCYEVYYCVVIIDEVFEVVVCLFDWYILDCFLLDKVIDVIDEFGFKVCLKFFIMLKNVKEMENNLFDLKKEKDVVV